MLNIDQNEAGVVEQSRAGTVERINSPARRPVRLSLAHNFMWTLPANVIYAACQWAVIVLLAKVASVEVVGQYALATAVAVPSAFLADFRLRVLFVTDAEHKYDFREMFGLRLMLAAVSIIVAVTVCGIAHWEATTSRVILLVTVAQLMDSLSETFFGTFQRAERMDRIAISLILRSMLSAGTVTVIVHFTHSLLWGVLGMVFAKASVLLQYDARYGTSAEFAEVGPDPDVHVSYFRRIRPRWNLQNQLEMLRVSWPLAVIAVAVSLNGYLPRYALESLLGRRDLGIYAAMGYIPTGYFMVCTALTYVAFARLSKLFAAGDLAAFKGLILKIAGICASLGLGGLLLSVVAGRQLLTIVYRPEYAQYVSLLRLLMCVGTLQCLTTAVQSGLTAASQFRVQVPLFITVGLITLAGCWVLVPRVGLSGAAYAVLISYSVQLCGSTFLTLRTMARRARDIKTRSCSMLRPAVEIR